jgi:hypothetical protein
MVSSIPIGRLARLKTDEFIRLVCEYKVFQGDLVADSSCLPCREFLPSGQRKSMPVSPGSPHTIPSATHPTSMTPVCAANRHDTRPQDFCLKCRDPLRSCDHHRELCSVQCSEGESATSPLPRPVRDLLQPSVFFSHPVYRERPTSRGSATTATS